MVILFPSPISGQGHLLFPTNVLRIPQSSFSIVRSSSHSIGTQLRLPSHSQCTYWSHSPVRQSNCEQSGSGSGSSIPVQVPPSQAQPLGQSIFSKQLYAAHSTHVLSHPQPTPQSAGDVQGSGGQGGSPSSQIPSTHIPPGQSKSPVHVSTQLPPMHIYPCGHITGKHLPPEQKKQSGQSLVS